MKSSRWVCPACTLLCDDVELQVSGRAKVTSPTCPRADAWLAQGHEVFAALPSEDLAKVASEMASARAPLIVGIENLDVASQQAAVKLAERFSAYLDVSCVNSCSSSLAAFQKHGKVTATLGEIAGRSDLILLWFCDPTETHPRFVERFLRKGSAVKKKVVVVDSAANSMAKVADESIVCGGDPAALIRDLRLLAQGKEVADDQARGLFAQVASAKYASVFLPAGYGAALVDAWHQLAREFNDHTRFVMSTLRTDRNAVGAQQVLASLTGFPQAIRFADGKPTYNGSEYAAADILARRECDFLLVCDVGADQPFEKRLDQDTLEFLGSIPVAVMTDILGNHYQAVDFLIPVATPGLSCGGDFHRLDDVSIPLTSPELTPAPEPIAVLQALQR